MVSYCVLCEGSGRLVDILDRPFSASPAANSTAPN